MELESQRTQLRVKQEEADAINAQLQDLISSQYQTLLGTSSSILALSQIASFLDSQLLFVQDTIQHITPPPPPSPAPLPQNSLFLDFLFLHESVCDLIQERKFLDASLTFIKTFASKDALLATRKFHAFLNRRLRVIASAEREILLSIRSIFRASLHHCPDQELAEIVVVFVKHAQQSFADTLLTVLEERRIHVASLLAAKSPDVIALVYRHIIDTYAVMRRLASLEFRGSMQLVYNTAYDSPTETFLAAVQNIDEQLLAWKRSVQEAYADEIAAAFDRLESCREITDTARALAAIRQQCSEDDLIYDSLLALPLNRRANACVRNLWNRSFAVFQTKNDLAASTLHTKINLNTLFFENCVVRAASDFAAAFVDRAAVVSFASSFETCFSSILADLDEVYNSDGTCRFPQFFALERSKHDVFADGFALWSNRLLDELYEMNSRLEKNKHDPAVFRDLFLEFLCYACFVHHCCSTVLVSSAALTADGAAFAAIKSTLASLAFKAAQYFFDTLLINLRVPFLRDVSMDALGCTPTKNIVWARISAKDGFFYNIVSPSYLTERFYYKLHCIVLCLGTVDSSIALYCHTQLCLVLLKLFEDHLKANGKEYAVQLLCDLTTMQYACARVFYVANKDLPTSFVSTDRLDKLKETFHAVLARIAALVEAVRAMLDNYDFFLFLHTSKKIARAFYDARSHDLPLLFPPTL